MFFDLKQAKIYKAVSFYKLFSADLLKVYRVLFIFIGLVPFIFVAVSNVISLSPIGFGLSFIFFPLALSIIFFELFGAFYLRYPKIEKTENIAELLEFEAAIMFDRAFRLSAFIGEKELSLKTLLAVMMEDKIMAKLIKRIFPGFTGSQEQLKNFFLPAKPVFSVASLFQTTKVAPEIMGVLEEASLLMEKHEGYRISVLDILTAAFNKSDELRQLMLSQDIDKNDLEELANWYEHIWNFWRKRKKFWNLENLMRQPPIGKDWVFGYAKNLKAFAVNLTDKMEFSRPRVRLVVRKREIEQIEQILVRSGENNVLLVGEEGVGKEQIIMDFTEMVARGEALGQLNYKNIFDLDLALVAGASKSVTDVQNILIDIFNEGVKAGNAIIVLRDFHNFIGEIEGMGRIDVSEILIPYLRSSGIQIIATTSPSSFHKFIEGRSELMDVFERININEPDKAQTLEIIEESVPSIEARYNILITYGAIKEIVSGADKFIRSAPFPEKAFDLMGEVVSYATANKKYIILKQDVSEVISRKTGVPLGPIAGEERDKLKRLEELMHQKIVGQDRAVEVVASTMRRLRTGLAKRGKPAGVFLFVGPTGVGKTLTAKILAETYFGSKDRMLRFDMSEYQDIESLDRFLGSTRTQEPGQFVTMARDNPFSLILLDELEKANRNILNIFLQVFDEGYLTDVFGRKINFEQNIIIATSNAGAESIRDMVKEGLDPSLEKEKVVDILVTSRLFTPELLNRFDEIVIFHPLSEDQVGKITNLLMVSLAERLRDQGYLFKPNSELAEYVAKKGFDPQFGARPMERVIRDRIENAIAKKILDSEIKKGVEFTLSPEDLR